jgi:adenylosuccinate synthase
LILEGTQGFGLSLLHSPDYPFVTSRDTSAAGVAAEAGVSPLDIDDVVLVIRSYPIRVGGNSGPLRGEVDWATVRERGKHDHDISEFTTVTKRLRRVGDFDAAMVRQAIALNAPRHIVMNHLDYIDHDCCVTGAITQRVSAFLEDAEAQIGAPIDYVGVGPQALLERTRRRGASSPSKITIGRS